MTARPPAHSKIHPARRPELRRAAPPAILFAAPAILIAVFWGAPAGAQYTSPGQTVPTSAIPQEESLEMAMDSAPWDVGPLRLSPWIGVRDAAFVTTETEGRSENDFTVTAGAGLRAYLPTGKLIWTVHALPEYAWWQDNDVKSRLNGRYGLALFGFFNRLTVEASLRRAETQNFFSNEIRELTSSRSDTARLGVEVALARRLTLFVIGEGRELASQEDESAIFPLLDREAELLTAGIRYRTPRGWSLGLGFEDSSTTFVEDARNLSNSGTSTLIDLGFEGSRFDVRLALASRDLEADPGSDFGVQDRTTGSLEALWKTSPKLNVLTYSHQRQTFSVDLANSYTIEERQGIRLDYKISSAVAGVFGEIGDDEFELVGGGVGRLDDVSVLGLDVRFALGRYSELSLRVVQTRYDSNLDEFDRDVSDVRFSFQLRGLTARLQLGQAGGDW